MASLYHRANPRQAQVLRIVEGAVRNAAHCHPEYGVDDRFARSAAKRAAGTMTAAWPDLLATALQSSDKTEQAFVGLPVSGGHNHGRLAATGLSRKGQSKRGAVSPRRSPLVKLWKYCSSQIRPAMAVGNFERGRTLIEICRLIAEAQRAP